VAGAERAYPDGMPFEDLYAFKDQPPDDLYDDRRGDDPRVAGQRVVYRLGVQSMEIHGMPDELRIGRVTVHQTTGPIRTQRTEVVQRAGIPLVFDKLIRTGIPVGEGLPLSVCQIEDTLAEHEPNIQFNVWRDEALAALGLLTALLDERVAQEFVFEDAVAIHDSGQPFVGMDVRRVIRDYYPYPVVPSALPQLEQLADVEVEGPLATASRWYLRAVRSGPQADAIVYFWTAIEALLGPADGSKADQLQEALRAAGADPDPDDMPLSVSRLSWIRGEVLHRGNEQPDDLTEGYYTLEAITRILLRERLGLEGVWPLLPDPESFASPVREQIMEAWNSPPVVNLEVVQHDPWGLEQLLKVLRRLSRKARVLARRGGWAAGERIVRMTTVLSHGTSSSRLVLGALVSRISRPRW
jgi:hypothetical protein